MKATEVTSRWAASLLGGCRLADEFLAKNAEAFPSKALQEKAKSVRLSLQIFMERESSELPFGEACALALSAPGVVHGFIQQTAALDETEVTPVHGGAGEWVHGYVYRDTYRVFIHTGSKFYEAQNADLLAAIREAFEKLGLKLPKELA